MKLIVSSFVAFSTVVSCSGTTLNAGQRVAVVNIPRGGGIFSNAVKVAESESAKLAEKAKTKAAELDEAADKLKDQAIKRAQEELTDLEKEARRLAAEAEQAARSKAEELERAARDKASEYQNIAKETALQVASRWEREATRRVAEAEKALKRKAAEVEKQSRKRAAELERSYRKAKGSAVSAHFGSIVSRGSRSASVETTTTTTTGASSQLLSQRTNAILAHVLLIAVACTSLANIFGWPPDLVNHWEGGFGDRFFPFDGMDLVQKRILAGVMELSSVFLMRPKKTRLVGTGLITAMYTWGTIVNTQLNQAGKAVSVAVLSAVAWLLFANEVF